MADSEVPAKIFGIGMFKTGTTSLGLAFENFGYRTFHGPFWDIGNDPFKFDHRSFAENTEPLDPLFDSYDAFEDYPFMFIHRYLADRFPSAKFVLTERDAEAVAESDRQMWLNGGVKPKDIPPATDFVDRYREHHQDVLDHFSLAPHRLLRVEAGNAEHFDALCQFVGKDPAAFDGWPRANVGVHRRTGPQRVLHRIKKVLRSSPTVVRGPAQD